MDKSIETIWKEGFLNKDALVAPIVNDLYNQKSKNTVDKLLRMGKMNLILIMIGALLILIASYFAGVLWAGAIMFVLFTWLVVYGKKEASNVTAIDKGLSSYQYIKAVDNWLKATIKGYTRIYRFVYPGLFLTYVFGYWSTEEGQEMLNEISVNSPDMQLVFGVPVFLLAVVLLTAGIISLAAGPIYKFDLKLVYGRVFSKLDEIIADMKELSDE